MYTDSRTLVFSVTVGVGFDELVVYETPNAVVFIHVDTLPSPVRRFHRYI
jgi:hypothetical protein